MNKKAITSIIGSVCLLLLASAVAFATNNVLAGVVAMPLATAGFQAVTGLSLFEPTTAAYATLAAIPRTPQQTINPGGARRLFLIATDQFAAEYPKRSLITDGQITAAPTFITGTPAPAFVEVQVSDNSLKLDGSLKGSTGYQSWEQSLEVKIAGYTKEQCAAIDKLINTEVVAAVVMNDGQRVIAGSSFMGLQFEVMHTTGAKGSDRREWTLKAKQDGYMFNYMPVADSIAIPGVSAT